MQARLHAAWVLAFCASCDCGSKPRGSTSTTVVAARPHDPDVEILDEDGTDATTRARTWSDIALSDAEVYWLAHDQTRVLARPKSGGAARVAIEAEGGRIEGIGSSRDGVFVAENAGSSRVRIVHLDPSGRRIDLGTLGARFFAMAAGNDGVFVQHDGGVSFLRRGEPARLVPSSDFVSALAACPFGATWLATPLPGDAGASLEGIADARASRTSAVVVLRGGATTTLVSGLVEERFGDLACDAESVFWSDLSGVHRVLASGTGEPTLLAKPPAVRDLAVIGDALTWTTGQGLDRLFLRGPIAEDGADAARLGPTSFTRDDAAPMGRPLADATHVYWRTLHGVRRKKR